ncbi:MAG TPA: sugar transferase, partial [Chloroflexota bacterium]|nr:sugar transferase [Chloroflexota bacterium]
MFDLVVAAIALTIACPLIVVAALYLKVALPGPGFLREERAGRGGKAFRLIRLSPTGAGRLLNVSGIAALPELVNVLRGEMSMVGPRPVALADAAWFTPSAAR